MSSPRLTVREIDRQDAQALHEWWALGRDASAHRPFDPWPDWEISKVALPADNPERQITFTAAFEGDELVGTALMALPLRDNPHLADLEIWVRPEHRRQGIGSTLLSDLEVRAHEAGRATLTSATYSNPHVASSRDGLAFALARGFAEANIESTKVVSRAYFEAAASHIDDALESGYRIVTVDTITPDDYIQGLCDLLSTFFAQIPLGDLDLRGSEWTPQRVRDFERRCEEIGERSLMALALGPDGEVVGMSDVNISEQHPARARIGATVVDDQHRGHRLGIALKLANHRLLWQLFPDCARVATSNADANQHMNRVNEQLGYRAAETVHELQKRASS